VLPSEARDSLITSLHPEQTALLPNLGRMRRELGPVTPDLSDALADHMRLRRGHVAEVASFYSYLDLPVRSVRVCTGPVCSRLGERGARLDEARRRAPDDVPVVEVPCLGHCDIAPVEMHGDVIATPGTEVPHTANDGPSLGLGRRDATLADYEARGGLGVLRNTPDRGRILDELAASRLRGLGGAGFPTHRKWAAVLEEPNPHLVVVNADEGEPGTFKDRYVMELRPHLLLEAVLISMRFLDATEAYIYIREEYATARDRLVAGIGEFRTAGILDGLKIELVVGAGSYVCGEETAMLESMEGRRGMPRLRPPFPAQRGYLGRATLVNNVETLAHVPAILRKGGDWFASLGVNGEAGVRLWSLSGAIRQPGCYEAPCGISLRELIEDHGGGATEEIGAIVPGGAASGILPPGAIDTPLTEQALREWGASVGSGAVQVFPRRYPVLRLLEDTMRFFAEEACQKCTPCRIGNRALHHLTRELQGGGATMTRAKVEEWMEAMERTSICGLGQTAPMQFRAAMRHWPELFEALETT